MYGVDMVEICLANRIAKITTVPLKTPKLKAMVFINTENTIILNSNRSIQEQNYDCTHEFIHIVRHSEIQNTFTCYDTTVINNNFYNEWEANEGAAELLVAYRIFIQFLIRTLYRANPTNPYEYDEVLDSIANVYNVPKTVIYYRIESLKYEITQYLQGIAIDELCILSDKQQKLNNIEIRSVNQIYKYDLSDHLRIKKRPDIFA